MTTTPEFESDESSPTKDRPVTYLLWFVIFATFGVGGLAKGVGDLVAGESHQVWKRKGGVVMVDKTFTGGMAVAFAVAQIAMGLGCLPLSLLSRAAIEARATRELSCAAAVAGESARRVARAGGGRVGVSGAGAVFLTERAVKHPSLHHATAA